MLKPGSGSSAISLYLSNVPLSEALCYIAEASGHRLSYDGRSYAPPVGVMWQMLHPAHHFICSSQYVEDW